MPIKSIVLIDDDSDDALLFKEALHELGSSLQFTHYDDGRVAVQQLSGTAPLPDLVFIDINLPSFSGWQCLTQLRKHAHLQELLIVMYTTSSVNREKSIAADLGANGFITKPDDFKLLRNMINNMIGRSVEELRTFLADTLR